MDSNDDVGIRWLGWYVAGLSFHDLDDACDGVRDDADNEERPSSSEYTKRDERNFEICRRNSQST